MASAQAPPGGKNGARHGGRSCSACSRAAFWKGVLTVRAVRLNFTHRAASRYCTYCVLSRQGRLMKKAGDFSQFSIR